MIEANMPESLGILLDMQLTVVDVSPAALSLLARNGPVLAVRQRRLLAPGDGYGLKHCLEMAARGRSSALLLHRSAQLPLTLRAEKWAAQLGSWIMVSLRDPELEVPDPAILQSLFGLTPTEAQVAVGLAQGLDSAALAHSMGVQANTVQSHVKRVLVKSGTRRQSQLVSLVLRSVAMRSHPTLAGGDSIEVSGLAQTGSDITASAAHSPPVPEPAVGRRC